MAEQEAALGQADTVEAPIIDTPEVTVESLAAEMGWSKEKFEADPENARSAADWIKSTNANNRNLKKEMKELRSDIEKIVKVSDKQVRREVEAAAREIQQRFDDAVENKDSAAAAKAAQEMRALEAESATIERDYNAEFKERNAWFDPEGDDDASAYAISVAMREAKKGKSPQEQLKAAEEAVLKRFPELSGEPEKTQRQQAAVTPRNDRTLSTKPKAKTYEDLPETVKSASKRFLEAAKSRGTIKDKDAEKAFLAEYAADYWAADADA